MRRLEWKARAGSWTVVFETHLQPLLPCRALGAQADDHMGHVPAWLEKQLMRTFWPKPDLFWPMLFKGSGGGEGVSAQPPWSEHEMQSPGCKALNTAAPDLPLSCLPGMEVSTLALRACDPDNSRDSAWPPAAPLPKPHLSPPLTASLCCQSHQQPQDHSPSALPRAQRLC